MTVGMAARSSVVATAAVFGALALVPDSGRASAAADSRAGTAARPPATAASYAGRPVRVGGLRLPARVQGRDVALGFGSRFEPRFWPGVNLGATVPGTFPGEVGGHAGRLRPLARRHARARRSDGPRLHDPPPRLLRRAPRPQPTPPRPPRSTSCTASGSPSRSSWPPATPTTRRSRTASGPRSAAPSRSCTATRCSARDEATPPGATARTSRDGCSDGRSGVEWDPRATLSTDRRNAGRPPYEGRYVTATPAADAHGELDRLHARPRRRRSRPAAAGAGP